LGLYGCRSHAKFIPREYLRSDVSDRVALLQGLVDSDGHVHRENIIEFATSSLRLAQDFVELVRSLGGVVNNPIVRIPQYWYEGATKKGRPSYRMHARFPRIDFTPVSSEKHLSRWKPHNQRKRKYLVRITKTKKRATTCFQVESPQKLFVTEGYNLTHNTVVALDIAARLGVPTIIVVDNNNLMKQWQEAIDQHLYIPDGLGQIQERFFDWKKPIVMATYQTLANRAEDLPEEVRRWFGLAIYDEVHHISAPTFCKSADLFYGYRLGLTATPERTDGAHVVCNAHLGGVLYKDLKQELKPRFEFRWTGLELNMEDPDVRMAVTDKNGELHLSKLSGYFGRWHERLLILISLIRGHVLLVR